MAHSATATRSKRRGHTTPPLQSAEKTLWKNSGYPDLRCMDIGSHRAGSIYFPFRHAAAFIVHSRELILSLLRNCGWFSRCFACQLLNPAISVEMSYLFSRSCTHAKYRSVYKQSKDPLLPSFLSLASIIAGSFAPLWPTVS